MKRKCLIAAVISFIIIGAISCFIISNRNKEHNYLTDKYAKSQLRNAADQISLNLSMYLAGKLEAAEVIAELIAKEKQEDLINQKNLTALKNIADKVQVQNYNICDINGKGYDLSGKEQKVDFCPYYQRALLGDSTIAFTNYYSGDKELSAVYTVPISNDNKIVGVLRILLDKEVIQDILTTNTFRGMENVYLIKRDGTKLMELSNKSGDNTSFLELLDKEAANYSDIEQVIKQGREILTKADVDKKVCYLSYKGIKNSNDWGVMITVPAKSLLNFYHDKAENQNQPILFALLGLVIVVIVGLTSFSVYQRLRRYQMERLAYYDEVINSTNYNRFLKDAREILHRPSRGNYAVIQLAVDKFDYIQDFFGTQESNRILKYIANLIRDNIKSEELFCRSNAENFAILLKYHNKDELTDRISYIDSRLLSFEGDVKNDKYELRFHYGIYCIEEKDTDIDRMVDRAYHALLIVKSDRKQPFEFYSDAMLSRLMDEEEIEKHMFTALEEKEFLVYLQPKFDLHTGSQVGAEALVRWMHPDKGLMYPGRFIGLFEKNGFIVKLDMYILEALCHRLKVWISKGYRPLPLSLNISRLNLYDEGFVSNMENILEQYGIPANLIELEIAEEVVADNMELLGSIMERLKEYGFLISMDDFGTGTTSMNTLYNVPVDELKIDRKFLLGAEKTDRGKNVIQSIIDMAKRLNIKVVSEGVENKLQAQMLKGLGCDMIQGFVFCEPMPIKEYENYTYGPRANENKIW